MYSRRTYPHGLKVEAAKAIFERRMTKQEAMRAFGITGKTRIETWYRPYRERGLDAPSRKADREGPPRAPLLRRGARGARARA